MAGKKRAANVKHKETRARSRTRGEKRRKDHIEANTLAEKANRALVAAGELTPWQQVKAARAARRVKAQAPVGGKS